MVQYEAAKWKGFQLTLDTLNRQVFKYIIKNWL